MRNEKWQERSAGGGEEVTRLPHREAGGGKEKGEEKAEKRDGALR